ncbi:MAG: hypothetical protein FJ029_09900 [Actinobacteria bacterium]|nr:hypothetical protein [Actinomycetota bacterium]
MAAYVGVRLYTLNPGADPEAFERVFATARPARGLAKIILLKGYHGGGPRAAQTRYDYASLHFYTSLEASEATSDALHQALRSGDVPDDLRGLIGFWRVAHTHELAVSVANGFTQVCETP